MLTECAGTGDINSSLIVGLHNEEVRSFRDNEHRIQRAIYGDMFRSQHFIEMIQVIGYCHAIFDLAKMFFFNIHAAAEPQSLTLP